MLQDTLDMEQADDLAVGTDLAMEHQWNSLAVFCHFTQEEHRVIAQGNVVSTDNGPKLEFLQCGHLEVVVADRRHRVAVQQQADLQVIEVHGGMVLVVCLNIHGNLQYR